MTRNSGCAPAETSAACYGAVQKYVDDGTVTLADDAAFAACAAYVDGVNRDT